MHLADAHDARRIQAEDAEIPAPIFAHGRRIVADAEPKVERVIRRDGRRPPPWAQEPRGVSRERKITGRPREGRPKRSEGPLTPPGGGGTSGCRVPPRPARRASTVPGPPQYFSSAAL